MLKKKSIGTKITLLISIMVLAAFILMSVLTYSMSSSSLEKSIIQNMQAQAKNSSEILSEKLSSSKNMAGEIVSKDEVKSMDWNLAQSVLYEDASNTDMVKIGISDRSGATNFSDGSAADFKDKEFFKDAVSGNTVISEPFKDASGKLVIYIATPIVDGVLAKGVLICVFDGQYLSKLCSNINVGSTGSAFILSSDGTMIGNKDQSLVAKGENTIKQGKTDSSLKELSNIEAKMVKGTEGTSTYTYKGQSKYISYSPVAGTTWSLAITADKNDVLSQIDTLRLESFLFTAIFVIALVFASILIIRRVVTKPLTKAVSLLQELSKGHLGQRLEINTDDEVGKMAKAMNELADTLQLRVLDTMRKISNGESTSEIEMKDADDEITPVLNNTITTVKSIVDQTNRIIDSASEGNLEERITESEYSGNWAKLAHGVNNLMDTVSVPINEVCGVISNLSENDYTKEVTGTYKGVFKNLADDVNILRERLLNIQDVIVRISQGDTSRLREFEQIKKQSENDNMIPAVNTMMHSIESLIVEVDKLSEEAIKGNIREAHGAADQFNGGYKKIVEGFNNTISAISDPFTVILGILQRMSVNDFTMRASEEFKGDFLELARAVNNVQSSLIKAQNAAVKISNGDISELENFKAIGRKSENDELIPAFIGMMESISLLIDETTKIAGSAAQGELDMRGDASKFKGEYVGIINSINSFMDAVEKPTNQITMVMESISQSKFGETIDGEFNGKFKDLVNAVNRTSLHLEQIIKEVSAIIKRMANGDFGIEKIRDYDGEFKDISDAINIILNSLNELFYSVNQTAAQVAAGSAQVSQGSQLLSQGATEQASAVEELTDSISVIASQTKENAISSGEADSLVKEVKVNASNGNKHMDDMLKSMTDISEASNNISKIIKVIDDIAFQTNILALNAAVEAARAGQYGKGFAVVADEVRSLASRSANAAQETTSLIESTIEKVDNGTEIANNTAEVFSSIVDGVEKASELVSKITVASNQQATSITEINKSLEQVSNVVQTNSATAEQSAAASEELSTQAAMLNENVSRFILRDRDSSFSAKTYEYKTDKPEYKRPEPERYKGNQAADEQQLSSGIPKPVEAEMEFSEPIYNKYEFDPTEPEPDGYGPDEPETEEIDQIETEQTETEQTETEQAEAEQTETEQTETEQAEAEQTETEQTEIEQTETEQTETEQTETEQTETEQTETEQTETEQTETEQVKSETEE